jgi:lysophospholipase L1-like esterase
MEGQQQYWQKISRLFGSSLIAYWPLWENNGNAAIDISGNNRNGIYATPLILSNTYSPGNKYAPLFTNGGKVNLNYASLQTIFPFTEGTLSMWYKVSSSSIYTDSTTHVLAQFLTNSSNRVILRKSSTNNRIDTYYIANAASLNIPILLQYSDDWQLLTATWSLSGDAFSVYLNGKLVETKTGLGTWQGTSLDSGSQFLCASASSDTTTAWSGNISDCLILNRSITSTEALNLYNLAKGYKRKNLSILGDSICNNTDEFPYVVIRTHNRGADNLINHAVAGASISANLTEQSVAAINDNADIIIIELGTNDDNTGDMASLKTTIAANIDYLKLHNPNAIIYYMNLLPRWTDSSGSTVVDKSNIRTAISEACASKSIICWDTFTIPWIEASDTSDGLHPTSTGTDKIATEILARI